MKKYLMIIMIILSLLVTTGCPHPEDPSIPTGNGSSNGTNDNDKEPDDPEPKLPVYDLKVYDLTKEDLTDEEFCKIILQRCESKKYNHYYNEDNGLSSDSYYQYVTLVLDTEDFRKKNPLLTAVEAAEACSHLGLSYRINHDYEIYSDSDEYHYYRSMTICNNILAGSYVFPNILNTYKIGDVYEEYIKFPEGGWDLSFNKNKDPLGTPCIDYVDDFFPIGFKCKWFTEEMEEIIYKDAWDNYYWELGGGEKVYFTNNINLNEQFINEYKYKLDFETEPYLGSHFSTQAQIQKVSIDYVFMKLPSFMGETFTQDAHCELDQEEMEKLSIGKEAVGYPAILEQIDYSQFYRYNVIPGKF